jgi:hypothetical protein
MAHVNANVLTSDAFDKWAIENHTRETVTKGASTPVPGASPSVAYDSKTKTITQYVSVTDLAKKITNDGNTLDSDNGLDAYVTGNIKTLPNGKIIVIEDK